MKVLTPDEFEAKFDFVRPINPAPEPSTSTWCIPFEYGDCPKGTKVSIAMAKQISAELRSAVAEAEKRELRVAFDEARASVEDLKAREAKAQLEAYAAVGELAALKRKIRSGKGRKK